MVLCGVILCRRFCVVNGMCVMAVGDVRVVAGRLLVATSLVLSRFSVMAGCMLMVLRRFLVVFCAFFAHRRELFFCGFARVRDDRTSMVQSRNQSALQVTISPHWGMPVDT
jgi:hypothetical protein